MGITTNKFIFNGTKEEFLNKTNVWLTSTTDGRRYRIKAPKSSTVLKIKRGLGFFTGPIFMEFNISSQMENSLNMFVNGYVTTTMFIIPTGKFSLNPKAKLGGLPRRNGWKDLEKLLKYIGIVDYTVN